jgi:hypothetical protein
MQRTGRFGIRIPAKAKYYSRLHIDHIGSEAHTASYGMGSGDLFRGKATRGVKFTTHVHLSPRLRMNGAIPPVSPCPLIVWTETDAPVFLL